MSYLIDPEARTIEAIDLPDKGMLDAMRHIVGGDMDHSVISDEHDSIWLYEFGLKNGDPVHAFKLPIQHEPFAGRAIIIGADDEGRTRAPFIPLSVLERDVEWLGVIVPTVEWVEEPTGIRAVVTYSRPSRSRLDWRE
jgi:hypothetical protein